MTIKVEEKYKDGKLNLIRIFHDVTELKEIESHTGDVNGLTDEIHEYYCYQYEVYSHNDKLGSFSKNENTKISFQLNVTEQLQ